MAQTVRWFAGAAQAVGLDEEQLDALPSGSIREVLVGRHPEAASVLARCSFLADGKRLDAETPWPAEAHLVDVLPPFAGG